MCLDGEVAVGSFPCDVSASLVVRLSEVELGYSAKDTYFSNPNLRAWVPDPGDRSVIYPAGTFRNVWNPWWSFFISHLDIWEGMEGRNPSLEGWALIVLLSPCCIEPLHEIFFFKQWGWGEASLQGYRGKYTAVNFWVITILGTF